jgi:hypothetical protein
LETTSETVPAPEGFPEFSIGVTATVSPAESSGDVGRGSGRDCVESSGGIVSSPERLISDEDEDDACGTTGLSKRLPTDTSPEMFGGANPEDIFGIPALDTSSNDRVVFSVGVSDPEVLSLEPITGGATPPSSVGLECAPSSPPEGVIAEGTPGSPMVPVSRALAASSVPGVSGECVCVSEDRSCRGFEETSFSSSLAGASVGGSSVGEVHPERPQERAKNVNSTEPR